MESPLGSDLARLVRIWRALIDHRLKPLELTQTHWVTLHNIHQLPPDQSQIQLAKAIGIEQPSLVRTLDQLEEKGLISRQTCASDRRAKRIKLTEKAEPLISESTTFWKATHGRPVDFTLKKRYLVGHLDEIDFVDTASGKVLCRIQPGQNNCSAR